MKLTNKAREKIRDKYVRRQLEADCDISYQTFDRWKKNTKNTPFYRVKAFRDTFLSITGLTEEEAFEK